VKIGSVDLEIKVCFKERNDRVYIFGNIRIRSYSNKVHQIYIQYNQIITDKHIKNQNSDIAIRFGMPGLRIKANSLILSILTLKSVTMATFLEPL